MQPTPIHHNGRRTPHNLSRGSKHGVFSALVHVARLSMLAMTTIHGRIIYFVVIILAAMAVASKAEARSLKDEHHCLALTLYWEARGEGHRGMTAVGWTVLNRVRSSLFPSTPCDVVFQGGERPPCQFSYWCDGKSDWPRDRHGWKTALVIAATLLVSPPRDPTYGALFYHSIAIRNPWKRKRIRTTRIGRHIFYR